MKTLTAITSSTTSPQRFDCRARITQAAFGLADPAAFGDLISLALTHIAFIGLQRPKPESHCCFQCGSSTLVGTADLLLAMVLGPRVHSDVRDFGLSYIIPTVYVPLLLAATSTP